MLEKIETRVDFNSGWDNGTDYYNGAVDGPDAPVLAPGEMAKSSSIRGRNIILIGTRFGNVVIFQRYYDNLEVIVSNVPWEVTKLMSGTSIGTRLTDADIGFLTGMPWFTKPDNIGRKFETLFEAWEMRQAKAIN